MNAAPLKASPLNLVDPDLVLLDWQAGETLAAGPVTAMRAKLRDRYIAARFPGVVRSSADLDNTERVIKAVRLFLEEQGFDRADELLDLAIGRPGSPKVLRLARLELAYLRRDAARFTECAIDLQSHHPDSPEWGEVARLGRTLAPSQSQLFGHAGSALLHDRDGPWPGMPDWLEPSWDLSGEVLTADFHREMAQGNT